MPTDQTLMTFFRHHLWSNLRLFDACLTLTGEQLNHSDPGTYGSIRATLIHLVRAEEWYLFLLTDQKGPTPESDAQTPLVKLKERVRQSGMMLLQVIENVQPDKLVNVGEGKEAEFIPKRVFLLQAIHHAHEHRTQVATLMGQLGIEPPAISGWSYFDEEIAPQQHANNEG
jgi:uncharacterized damage-inducible protein DinB